jgi:hypothetical protein
VQREEAGGLKRASEDLEKDGTWRVRGSEVADVCGFCHFAVVSPFMGE